LCSVRHLLFNNINCNINQKHSKQQKILKMYFKPALATLAITITSIISVHAADCAIDPTPIQTSDIETLANGVLTNNFNPPLPGEFSLGPFQSQPFPTVGSASICIFNNEAFQTVDFALSDVQFAIQNILDQCFTGSTGTHSTFTINSNDGSSNSVILSVNSPDFACD
jgi:hypothetical protein